MKRLNLVDEIVNSTIRLNPDVEFQSSLLKSLRYCLNKSLEIILGRVCFYINVSDVESIRIDECLIIQKYDRENYVQLFLSYLDNKYTIDISSSSIIIRNENNRVAQIDFTNNDIKCEVINYENSNLTNTTSYIIKNLNNFDQALDETECPRKLRSSVMFELIVKDNDITSLSQMFYLNTVNRRVLYELISSKMVSTEHDYLNIPFNMYMGNKTCDIAISLDDSTDNILNHLDFVFAVLENTYDKNMILSI